MTARDDAADVADTNGSMAGNPERHHWLNVLVGTLDSAFYLTEEEQLAVISIVRKLLIDLQIPERGVPDVVPLPVALEMASSFYTVRLSGPRDADLVRPVRVATPHDIVVTVETWSNALVGLLTGAYQDLAGLEVVHAQTVFTQLLVALGVPNRAAAHFPDEVLRAYGDAGQ